VVTSLEFRLHPVREIYGGPMFYELSEVENVLRFYREYIADAPEQMGAFPAFQIAPPLPFIPEDRHGDTFVAIVACWAGPSRRARKRSKPFHDVAPVVAEFVGPMPYPALNAAFDGLLPPGLQHYWKASFVKELTDEAISAHAAHGPDVPAVNSTMHIYPINGAAHRTAPGDTAFAYRDANFATVIAGSGRIPFRTTRTSRGCAATTTRSPRIRRRAGTSTSWRGRPGSDQGELHGQLRSARRRQAGVRPGQPVPPEPEHRSLGPNHAPP
jgi:hypothetical protein